MATSSESSETARKITLKSADNTIHEVEEAIAMEFMTIKAFFDETPSNDTVVPLPNVASKPLADVIEYCRKELEFRSKGSVSDEAKEKMKEEKKKFDDEFLAERTNDDIKEMILAANYLNIKYLLDFLTLAVAERIKNKSVEYVRKFFGIENDFTAEEEANLRAENEWAFEGVDPDD